MGDITDYKQVLHASQGCDIFVHLAGNTGVGPSLEDPRDDMFNNVLGIFNCLEAARSNHYKRFVFASSGAPLGDVEPPIHEGTPAHPASPYGASKLAGEATVPPIITHLE